MVNMKKLIGILMSLAASWASANTTEIINISSPYTASHRGHVAIHKMLERANQSQTQYRFILNLKPGGAGVVALRSVDSAPETTIGLIHASFVQNSIDGLIDETNYVPISSLGDACWFIVSKFGDEKTGFKSLSNHTGNLMFGGVGVGSASHLTSIEIGSTINKSIQWVPFQSAADANILMVGNHDLNLSIMSASEFDSLYEKNKNLKRLGMHCNRRHPSAAWVLTTKEQGIKSPYVFNTFVVSKNMPLAKQRQLAGILDQSIIDVGADYILESSSFHPPVFDKIPVAKFHSERVLLIKDSLKKHQLEIDRFKKEK